MWLLLFDLVIVISVFGFVYNVALFFKSAKNSSTVTARIPNAFRIQMVDGGQFKVPTI